jgi:flagellar basal-body rod protein FlgF
VIPGLYSAASGLMSLEARQDVIANNIANAATPGFKRQNPIVIGFDEIFSQRLVSPTLFDLEKAPGGGLKPLQTYTDLSPGVTTTTGNPLNVALSGPGYLSVMTPNGERFTRDGTFKLNAQGDLVTAQGHRISGRGGGPINVSGGEAAISERGEVTVDGVLVGQLEIIEFNEPRGLQREGENLYAAPDEVLNGAVPAAETTLIPGALELSNVKMPVEMMQMMLGLRAYAANQQVIDSTNQSMSRLIDQVGMSA